MKKVERWKMEMPTEEEMLPKDKYTVFDRKVKRYRKGIHSTCGNARAMRRRLKLTWSRGPKVDEGQPETESPGFLDASGREHVEEVYTICHQLQHPTWRTSGTNNLCI
jgi:hypothetical protein